jgi:Carboxypeptidase regulatory-like domain
MHRFATTLVLAAIAVLAFSSRAASTAAGQGAIRGAIADSSGGALPGVTVVATSVDGRVVATTVTDGTGAYELSALPAGQVRLTFQLDGFATADASAAVQPNAVSIVTQRLELAPVTETVVVVGRATDSAPPAFRAPPPPVVQPVAAHDRDSVCGPAKPEATPESFGTIRSRRETARQLYAIDDELVIDGGTLNGLEIGQNLVVRRYFRVMDATGAAVTGEHTAGVLQIVAAHEHVSSAVVVYACDELMKGDFLASFKPEPIRSPDPAGVPAYDAAARILYADAGQMLGAPRRLMVIDRGSEHGIHVGQRVTLFRRRGHGAKPAALGDAVVVALRSDSATIRVEGVSDVISSGDWAAPHRASPLGSTRAAAAGSKHP